MARLICGEKGSALFCDSGETIIKNGEEQKQTNADRIRGMADEELDEFLEKVVSCGRMIENECTSERCRGCRLPFCGYMKIGKWLKSEVEE